MFNPSANKEASIRAGKDLWNYMKKLWNRRSHGSIFERYHNKRLKYECGIRSKVVNSYKFQLRLIIEIYVTIGMLFLVFDRISRKGLQ